MSRSVVLTTLSTKDKEEISKELTIEIEQSKYSYIQTPKVLNPYQVEKGIGYFPFAYKNFPRRVRSDFGVVKATFKGELRPEQAELQTEAINHLNKNGSIIIAAYTGFGKTCTSMSIISKVGMQTLVLAHRIVLIEQWKKAVNDFLPGLNIQVVDINDETLYGDICIINPINIPKKPRSFYNKIGFVIVDECHLIMAEGFSKSMLSITPRYVLGLSATPYRTDGLDILLDLYFGKEKIVRKLEHAHTVYTVNTNIEPVV
jgi:superfamily II DNA or RNA helicase